jgi:hypothetical protein
MQNLNTYEHSSLKIDNNASVTVNFHFFRIDKRIDPSSLCPKLNYVFATMEISFSLGWCLLNLRSKLYFIMRDRMGRAQSTHEIY